MERPLQIFCCYAREDQSFLLTLTKHLKPLQHGGLIIVQADIDISPGEKWEQKIQNLLDTSDLILLLISPDFMSSDYCYGKEMKQALARHERGEARVIPVILRPVVWQIAPFAKLQVLPTGAVPIVSSQWNHQDEAFFNVAEGIRKLVEDEDAEGNDNIRLLTKKWGNNDTTSLVKPQFQSSSRQFQITDTLMPNEALAQGQLLVSPNGRFILIMQDDGNLVEKTIDGQLTWQSDTKDYKDVALENQNDGNIVLRSRRSAIWATGTDGKAGTLLKIQDDGDIVVLSPESEPLSIKNISFGPRPIRQ